MLSCDTQRPSAWCERLLVQRFYHNEGFCFYAVREFFGLKGGVEFLVVTRWESLEAIAKFAGPDPEVAVVPAKAVSMMIEYDHRARHFEILQ